MSITSALVFTFSLFGTWFAFRISEKMREKRLIDRKMRSYLRLLFVILIAVFVFLCARHPIFLWISIVCGTFSLQMSQLFIRRCREQNFKSQFLEFLERVILLVRAGKSFRQALTIANQDNEAFSQQRLDKILEFVFFSQHSTQIESDKFTQEIVKELVQVDRTSHRSLERLIVMRRNLRLESDFRRKSEQVLRRIRWQSYIFTGLYVALFGFMISQFQFREILGYIAVSVTFFVTGLVWIICSGRVIKWKI